MVDSTELFDLLYIKCLYIEDIDLSKYDKDGALSQYMSPTITKIEIRDIIRDNDEIMYKNFASGPRTKEVMIYGIITDDNNETQWQIFVVRAIIASKHKVDDKRNIITQLYQNSLFDYFAKSLYECNQNKNALRDAIKERLKQHFDMKKKDIKDK